MIFLRLESLKTKPVLKVWQLNSPQDTFGVAVTPFFFFLTALRLRNQPFNLSIFSIANYLLSKGL